MDKEDIVWFKLMIVLVALTLVIAGGIGLGVDYAVGKFVCPRYAENVGLEYKYDYWAGGCFVNYQGQYILKDRLVAGKIDAE